MTSPRPLEACYRHPQRETGVSCVRCERPICPDCMITAPVGFQCPSCARSGPRTYTAADLRRSPRVTQVLVGVNAAVFVATLAGGADLGGGQAGTLLRDGALFAPAVEAGEWWRIVTSGFLHFGAFHLGFNLLALWILGSMIEPAVGATRFAAVYAVSLLAGSFGAILLAPGAFTAGASGGVFGLMGCAVVGMRRRGINVMESGLGVWLLLNLFITFAVPGISIGGHLGGLLGGALAGLLVFEVGDRLRGAAALAVPVAGCAVLAALAVAGALGVAHGAIPAWG